MRNSRLYVKDIRDAMESIERFVEDMTFDQFVADDKTNSAVIRKLEVIGEAAKNISEEVKSRCSNVPWKEMAGMRDRLIHAYFGVNHNLVWETIKRRFPKIKPTIENILEEE